MANSEDLKKKLEIIKTSIGVHPDFPKPGIVFRDIFSVFRDREAYVSLLEIMKSHSQRVAEKGVQAVAALESRGFLFGPQIALDIGVPFFPIRKKGKLPGITVSVEYSLEYGKDVFEAQKDSIQPGDKILIVDDLLATGVSEAYQVVAKMEEQDQVNVCSFGNTDSPCHLTTYSAIKGLKAVNQLSLEQQELLARRGGLLATENTHLCLHHEALLLKKFEFLQRSCCNPFGKKNHTARKSLRSINIETADLLKSITMSDIKPGQKMCPSCRKEFDTVKYSRMDVTYQSDEDDETNVGDNLNTSLTSVGISPLKFQRIGARDTKGYAKRKIHQVEGAIIKKIAEVGGLDPSELEQASTSKQCLSCSDYIELIQELKEKLHTSNNNEKIQILTLVPQSWSIKKTMEEFCVSERMVRKARKLKAEQGILAQPKGKCGKKLSEDVKARVIQHFYDEEFSRICPGKKDCITVRIDGEKVQKQKYLLLSNLKEMFVAYRNKNGPEIGFSKFCELRPKWCVTVGTAGSHSVCVCTIHQNVKLMLAHSPIKEDYKILLSKIVCNLEIKDCMLHRCELCPGTEVLKEYLESAFADIDPEDTIQFKQWTHTDRDTLETREMTVEEFIELLVTKLFTLSTHHYIAKHQSKHLKFTKEGLKPGELIILMDFAENYSFIVQDAVQAFHWENSQATIHPFVIYYKDNEDLRSVSYCIISDCLRHDTVAVHVFLTYLIKSLKCIFKEIKHIHYFSDGSAAQYKNFKSFLNLCHHQKDFGITAEWNFFGTSHGKSPCDGIGGTVKRLAARASLQRPIDNQILTPTDLFEYCKKNVHGIEFIYIEKEIIEDAKVDQEKRFEDGCTVSGTRDHHHFVPIDEKRLKIHRVSNDTLSFIANVNRHAKVATKHVAITELQPGQYIACIYDGKWWIGNVCEVSCEEKDALINFMHPHGAAQSLHWPTRRDICWIPEQQIIAVIPVPAASMMGRQYSLPEAIVFDISKKFKTFNN